MPACLYCGGTAYALLYGDIRDRLGHVPGTWGYARCRVCGSAILNPFPAPEAIPSFYPPVYTFVPAPPSASLRRRFLGALEHRLLYRPVYEGQARLVLRVLGSAGARGMRLLDVGCGKGLRLLFFRDRGLEVHGMDFQPADVAYVREALGIPAACCDFAHLPEQYSPGSFDVITAFHVLEHVPDVLGAVETCLTLLKPGGWFVAACPLLDSIQARLLKRRWIGVTEAPRHLSVPSRTGLVEVCRRAGAHDTLLTHDATLQCAGMLGLSLVPGAATTHLGKRGQSGTLLLRLLAAAASGLVLPWCLLENHLWRRPGAGMVFARKPFAQTQ